MKKSLFIIILAFVNYNISNAQNPELWTTCGIGGTYGLGNIFKINGDGTGFSPQFSFLSASSPQGNLIPYSGKLYGLSTSGGSHTLGAVFSYQASINQFQVFYNLDSASGYYPRGSMIFATNNKFYGTNGNGGANDKGSLFSFDPSNNTYTNLHDFDQSTGYYAFSKLFQASNGKIYGMASAGGANSLGAIFSYDPINNLYADVYDFNFADGCLSWGGFIEDPNDHLLYGMAFGGGALGYGSIFKFNPVNATITVLHSFNGTDGAAPLANLYQLSNGMMYGMTSQGGTNNVGVLFSFDPSNSLYTKLYNFSSASGATPEGNVIQASDGKLYGTTLMGGANNYGAYFSYDITNNLYNKFRDGSITGGGYPYGDFIEYSASTGVSENNLINVPMIFSNNQLLIITGENNPYLLKIVDVKGQEILSKNFTDQIQIDFANYPKGIYLIKGFNTNTNQYFIGKIVK